MTAVGAIYGQIFTNHVEDVCHLLMYSVDDVY